MSEARPNEKSPPRVLAKPKKSADSPSAVAALKATVEDSAASAKTSPSSKSGAPQKTPRAGKTATSPKAASQQSVAPTDLELAAAALDEAGAQHEPGICISIPSRAEYVRVVRLALLGVASRMPFSYDDVEDIKLAVAEACNNAIVHAGDSDALVKVTLTPYSDRLEIEVTDSGRVPPPGLIAPRNKAATRNEELRESGLGLFLMQTLMDEVGHETGADSDTKVRLVKYLPGSPHRKTAV